MVGYDVEVSLAATPGENAMIRVEAPRCLPVLPSELHRGGGPRKWGTFERLTEGVRRVLVLAREEASAAEHLGVGPEHILLAALREEDSLAARVLDSLGLTLERTRANVVRIFDRCEPRVPEEISIGVDLDPAAREALEAGHEHVGSEHILLSLTRARDRRLKRVLRASGADIDKIRSEIAAAISPGEAHDRTATFDRFSDAACQVVVLAQEEARVLGHDSVGPEHILLGLLREENGLAALALRSLGMTLGEVRARIATSGEDGTHGPGRFSTLTTELFAQAEQEALQLGHDRVGTRHLLLGLARADHGSTRTILLDFDYDAEKVRRRVRRLAGPPGGERESRRAEVVARKPGESLVVGDEIEVAVLTSRRGGVRLGIEVSPSIPVFRKEVYEELRPPR